MNPTDAEDNSLLPTAKGFGDGTIIGGNSSAAREICDRLGSHQPAKGRV